jgi:hypothetical protein
LSTGQPDPSSAKVPPILSKWNEPDVARSVAAGDVLRRHATRGEAEW